MALPDATPNPCSDCPWRRSSAQGWLGPFSAKDWVKLAQSDLPVACHLTIVHDDDWEQLGIKQCRGVAIFRKNICKAPRDPAVVVGPRDTEKVFGRGTEFMDHHDNTPLANFLAGKQQENPMTKLSEGPHLHCLECFSYTPVAEGETPSTSPCANCDGEGRSDPYCTELVRVSECPDPDNCVSDDHHFGLHQHTSDMEWS